MVQCLVFNLFLYTSLWSISFSKNIRWGLLTLASVALAMVSTIGFIFLHLKYGIKLIPYRLVSDSNAIFAVIVSVCSFMYFKDVPIKQSKLINTISASTFGVLCIHANSDTMRQWLWKDVVDCVGQYFSDQMVLLSLISIFCIFSYALPLTIYEFIH